MNFWERLLLAFCFSYGLFSNISICHDICDILFRHVLHINIFELELQKDPSEDSIAPLRMAVVCALLSFYITKTLPPHCPEARPPSNMMRVLSSVLRAVTSLSQVMDYRLSGVDKRLQNLETHNRAWEEYCKSLTKKVDLSNARKVTSNVSRKHLHVIARNATARHMRNLKIRLDAEQLRNIKLAFENKGLILSVTSLDEQIKAVVSEVAPSSEAAAYTKTNVEKLRAVRRTARQTKAEIGVLEVENNQVSSELRQKNEELDVALTTISESTKTLEKKEQLLEEATSAMSAMEISLRE